MSDEKSDKKRGGAGSLPPEAKRRGGMDTLFSAAWFDDEPAKGAAPAASDAPASKSAPPASRGGGISAPLEEPKGSNTWIFVTVLLVLGLGAGMLMCGGAGIGAFGYYYVVAMSTAG